MRLGIKIVAAVLTVGCFSLSLLFPNGFTLMAAIPPIIIMIGSILEDYLDGKHSRNDESKKRKIKTRSTFAAGSIVFAVVLIIYCLFVSLVFDLKPIPKEEQEPVSFMYFNTSEEYVSVENTNDATVDEESSSIDNTFYETFIFQPKEDILNVRIGNLKGFGYNGIVLILVAGFAFLSFLDIHSTRRTYYSPNNEKHTKE